LLCETEEGSRRKGKTPTGGAQLAAREKSGEEEVGRWWCLGRKRRWAAGREQAGGLKERGRGLRVREGFLFFQTFYFKLFKP
jgi:hypothetical protein